jgi:tetratricopeptide (TPR) repeat protein
MLATQNREQLQYRMAVYYLNKLRIAETAYHFGHEHSNYALRLLDQDWPQIEHWQHWAAAYAGKSEAIAQLCKEYPLASAEILALRQSPQNRIEWLQAGLEAAQRFNDRRSESALLYRMAAAYYDGGDFLKAEEHALEACACAEAANDLRNLGMSWKLLGDIYRIQGNAALARDYYSQSGDVFEELGDQRQFGKAVSGLGLTAWRQGEWEDARKLFTTSLAIARTFGQETDICDELIDLSLPSFVLGDVQSAYELLNECIARCRAINYHRVLAASLNTLGQFENDPAAKLAYFEEAVAICRKTGIYWDLSSYLNNMSFTLLGLGRYTEALEYTGEALTLSRASGQPGTTAYSLSHRVEIQLALGDVEHSRHSFREALEIARETDSPILKLHMLIGGMSLWTELDRAEEAAEWAGLMLSLPICASQEQEHIRAFCIKLEAKLGPSVFAAAMERGRSLDLDGVIQTILHKLREIQEPRTL